MATPYTQRIRQLRQAAAAKEAAVRAAVEEAALVAGRQRSLPKPRGIPVDDAPMHMDPTPGEVPRGPEGVGTSDIPPQAPEETLLRVNEIAPEDAPEIYRLLERLGNEGPQSLREEELLLLIRAGADPDRLMAGPLPPAQVQAILRKVANEGALTPEELAGLHRSNVDDDLDASSTPIETDATDPRNNLTPNRVRVGDIDSLAQQIAAVTADPEPVSATTLRRLQRGVDRAMQDPDARAELLAHPSLAAGIENIKSKTDPAARQAAMDAAQSRLDRLAEMAGIGNRERAFDRLESAADARAVAAAPRPAPASVAPADVRAARSRLEANLPEGDWNALTEVFNNLDPERKEAVLARLSSGRSLEPLVGGRAGVDPAVFKQRRIKGEDEALSLEGAAVSTPHPMGVREGVRDMTAARPFIESKLDRSTGELSFSPNSRAELARGATELEDALIRLDAAMRSGDEEAVAAARDAVLDFQTRPMPDDERQAIMESAKQSFLLRKQAESELRNAIIGTDPLYVDEQSRMIREAVQPAPRPAIAPGARTPIVPTEELGRADLPSAADDAFAEAAERDVRLDKQAPQGGLTQAQRREIVQFKGRNPRKLPLAFKGDDSLNPMESRAPGSRLAGTADREAIEQARELEAAIEQAGVELRLAQVQAQRAVYRAEEDAAKSEVLRLQGVRRQLLDMQDDLFPPRLVHEASGRVEPARAGMTSDNVPKGYVLERGYRPAGDGRLNAAGQQETIDNFIVTIVGGRPKAQPTLDRISQDLTPAERAVLNNDATQKLGERGVDTLDLLPESPDDEVVGLGQDGRRGRMGSTQQDSRVQAALRGLYEDNNPLDLQFEDGGFTYNVFENAEQAADDLLRRQTIFKPGTPSWDYAKEKITNAIVDTYTPGGRMSETPPPATTIGQESRAKELAEIKRTPAGGTTGTPARDSRAGTSQDPSRVPSEPGRENVRGESPAPAAPEEDGPDLTQFPSRPAALPSDAELEAAKFPDADADPVPGTTRRTRRKKAASAEDEKLDASDTTIIDPEGGDLAGGAARSDDDIRAEIEQEAQQIYDEEYRANIDSGMDASEAAAEARSSRNKHIATQTAARIKPTGGAPLLDGAATQAAEKPKGRRGGGRRGKKDPAAQAAASDTADSAARADADGAEIAEPTGRPLGSDDADIQDDIVEPTGRPLGADGADIAEDVAKKVDTTVPVEDKKKGWPWKRIAVGGAIAGLGIASQMNGNRDIIDIPIPPGGGGGGGGRGPGGDFYPVPGGTDGAGLMDEQAAQEAAILRALDRIRGSRGGGPVQYQTMQNYTEGR